MKPFSLLVKPVGAACNLACDYCFYIDKASLYPNGPAVMPLEVMERMVSSYLALPFDLHSITFQGGEPLLAGIEFFKAVSNAVKRHSRPKAKVNLSIQTNATLMTDDLAACLAAGKWLVGASLDGPRELNRLRGDSFDAAVRGIRLLEKHAVDYNLLTVVSKANIAHPAEVYRFLRDNFSTRFHQYIECTGPCDRITGEEWGNFLIGLFDEWIKRDANTISVRLFDSVVSQTLFGRPTQCSFGRSCRQYLVIEHDGSVYPCDFHVRDDLKLGNIATDSFESLINSPTYRRFSEAKVANLPKKCQDCRHLEFCNGDCPRNRLSLCAGWIKFFDHALPSLRELAFEAAFRRT